jgi:signal transduction histidine kinase/ligand-binding sensor domain-containing protein
LLTSISVFPQSPANRNTSFSRGYAITYWQTEDGLPQNSILQIAQSPDGFLWAGTQQGIVKFDGLKFKQFGLAKDSVFQQNKINTIAADIDSRVFVGTYNGGIVTITGNKTERSSFNSSLPSSEIVSLFFTSNRELLISTRGGFVVLRGGKLCPVASVEKTDEDLVLPVFEDGQHRVWAFTSKGKIQVYADGHCAQQIPKELNGRPVLGLAKGNDNTFWCYTDSMLWQFSLDNKLLQKFPFTQDLQTAAKRSLVVSKNGTVWIGTIGKGLFGLKGGAFIHFGVSDGLSNDLVSSLFIDKQDNLWIGTLAGGLNKLSVARVSTISAANGLTKQFVFSIAEAEDGSLWAGTYGGGIYSIRNGTVVKNFRKSDGLVSDVVRAVLPDRTGRLWVAGYPDGISLLEKGKWKSFLKADGLPDGIIYAFMEAKDGRMYIGTGAGLVWSDGKKLFPLAVNSYMKNPAVRSLMEDSSGTIWVGTDGSGIFKFSGDKAVRIKDKDNIIGNHIVFLFQDSRHEIWSGSEKGISRIIHGEVKSVRFPLEIMDPQSFYQILEDTFGYLWISSSKGVYRVSRTSLIDYSEGRLNLLPVTHYNRLDGMLSSECNGGNQPAGIRTKDGRILFPNLKGIVAFNEQNMTGSAEFPPVCIDEVKADEKSVPPADVLVIPAGSHRITINYSAINLNDPLKIRFRYRLVGMDNDWVSAENFRQVVYANLQPGDYEFQLLFTNDLGQWTENPIVQHIHVNSFFYETKLFWGLLLFLGVLLAWTLSDRRTKVLRERSIALEKIIEERTSLLRDEKEKTENALADCRVSHRQAELLNEKLLEANQLKTHLLDVAAHDLKNSLNAIRGFSNIIKEEMELPDEFAAMLHHITRLSDTMLAIINEMLKASALESGKLKLNITEVDVRSSINAVLYTFHPLAEKKNQIIRVTDFPDITIQSDENRLQEVLENLVSNAVKYTPIGGSLQIAVTTQPEHILIAVKDSGPGLTKDDMQRVFGRFEKLSAKPTGDEISTGLGLSIVKDLVELMGGTITVHSIFGEGAEFIVALPVSSH